MSITDEAKEMLEGVDDKDIEIHIYEEKITFYTYASWKANNKLASFLSWCRTGVPELVKEIEELRERLRKWQHQENQIATNAQYRKLTQQLELYKEVVEAANKFAWPEASRNGPIWLGLYEALNKLND